MHRFEVAWKKAQVYDTAIRLFSREAARKSPDFDKAATKVIKVHGSGVEPRHLEAINEELRNIIFALKTVRETKAKYGKTPGKLYHAIFGHRLRGVKLAQSDFSIAFVLPKKAYEKTYGTDSGGKANVSRNFRERQHSREETLRRQISKELGVKQEYLRALSTVQKHDFGPARKYMHPKAQAFYNDFNKGVTLHEENHVISGLIGAHSARPPFTRKFLRRSEYDRRHARAHSNAGKPSPRPKFEEVFTEAGYNLFPSTLPANLVEKYKIFGTDVERKQHTHLDGLLTMINWAKKEKGGDLSPELKAITRISNGLETLGITLPKLTGKSPSPEQIKSFEDAAKVEMKKLTDSTKASWEDKLKEIDELKFDYGLPANLVQMLTRTHDLDEVPRIIRWNLGRLQAIQLPALEAIAINHGRKKSPFQANL